MPEYQWIFDASPDAYLVTDNHHLVLKANPAFTSLLGYTPAEVVGRHPQFLLASAHEVRPAWPQALPGSISAPQVLLCEHKDGSLLDLEIRPVPIRDERGRLYGYLHTFRPLREHQPRPQEVQPSSWAIEGLQQAFRRDDLLPVLVRQMMFALQAQGVALLVLSPTSTHFVCEVALGAWRLWAGQQFEYEGSVEARVLASGEHYWSNDIRLDPSLNDQDRFSSVHAVACVPVGEDADRSAVLWVGRRFAFNPDEVHCLVRAGHLASQAMNRGLAERRARRQRSYATAVRRVNQAISQSGDLALMLDVVLEQAIRYLHVEAADILLLDQERGDLAFINGRGFSPPAVHAMRSLRPRVGEEFPGQVAAALRKLRVTNIPQVDGSTPRGRIYTLEGFTSYLGVPLISGDRLVGVLELFKRTPMQTDQAWAEYVQVLADQTALAIEKAHLIEGLQRAAAERDLLVEAAIKSWTRALKLRDRVSEIHNPRLIDLTLKLAHAVGIPEEAMGNLRRGVMLHDVGKLGVPDQVLYKPGPLTEEEWQQIRLHPVYAYEMLWPLTFLRPALEIPYCHHERWDGKGYPRGLQGDDIPLAARVFAVVDVWDAMISERPYRRALTVAEARRYLQEQAGAHFDPQVVEVYLGMV